MQFSLIRPLRQVSPNCLVRRLRGCASQRRTGEATDAAFQEEKRVRQARKRNLIRINI